MNVRQYLDLLGLDDDADEASVRKAYATRLKAIDAAADPIAFARLREAYEAVRAHARGAATPTAPSSPTAFPAPAVDVGTADGTAMTEDAFADLKASLAATIDDDVPLVLDRVVGRLRTGPLSAMDGFEARLIEALRSGALPHGFEVFHSASELFGWQDIGARPLDPTHAAWLRRASAQAERWYRKPYKDRMRWMSRIDEARRHPETLPTHLGWMWPDIAAEAFPMADFTAVALPRELASRWASQFQARHARARRIRDACLNYGWMVIALIGIASALWHHR